MNLNARNTDPVTSHAAADRLAFRESQWNQILEALSKHGELGAEQIATHIQLQPYQIRKRLPELQDKGLVTPTERTRLTLTRREERVWRLLPVAALA